MVDLFFRSGRTGTLTVVTRSATVTICSMDLTTATLVLPDTAGLFATGNCSFASGVVEGQGQGVLAGGPKLTCAGIVVDTTSSVFFDRAIPNATFITGFDHRRGVARFRDCVLPTPYLCSAQDACTTELVGPNSVNGFFRGPIIASSALGPSTLRVGMSSVFQETVLQNSNGDQTVVIDRAAIDPTPFVFTAVGIVQTGPNATRLQGAFPGINVFESSVVTGALSMLDAVLRFTVDPVVLTDLLVTSLDGFTPCVETSATLWVLQGTRAVHCVFL